MPRGQKQEREIFTCEKCGVKQPISNSAHRSVSCFGCGTVFAIVRTPEDEKALVPFFNQERLQRNTSNTAE